MKTTLLTLGALAALVAAPVFAATPDADKTAMMADASLKMMDTNGDGMVSMDERAAACQAMFTKADANADGQVTSDEMVAAATQEKAGMGMTPDPAKIQMMVSKKLTMMDTDKSGTVSLAEDDAASQAMFKMSDTNGDGMLSRQELIDGMMKHKQGM